MTTYSIYIKSHDLNPDFEAEVQADKRIEAVNMFYEMLHGEFDTQFIEDHMMDS